MKFTAYSKQSINARSSHYYYCNPDDTILFLKAVSELTHFEVIYVCSVYVPIDSISKRIILIIIWSLILTVRMSKDSCNLFLSPHSLS